MKVYEFYFSPTGGTKKAADLLAKGLTDVVIPIDLTGRNTDLHSVTLTSQDVAVIAVPSYGGRVPAIAIERLNALRGNDARAVLVCVYGNRAYEDTLVELQDAAHRIGLRTVAAVAAIAEHSIARQFASGRPDAQDQQQLSQFAQQIRTKLADTDAAEPAIPGNRPYRKAGGVGMVPKPTKACVSCGICAKECPVAAIDPSQPKNVDAKACISCMRCISVCPHGARGLNRVMLSAAGLALKKVCSVRKDCQLYL